MKKIVMLLSAVVGLAAFTPKAIEAHPGFYVGTLGGANFLQTDKRHSSESGNFELDFDTGYNIGGFLGYEFCGGFAVEAEFTWRHNTLRSIKFGSYSSSSSSDSFRVHGHLNSMAYMANFIYDIHLSRFWCMPITPYIGAGIGYEQQRLKVSCFSEKKNGFAWQVLAGIGYDISPCFDVSLDYRFNEGRARHVYNHSLGVAAAYHF